MTPHCPDLSPAVGRGPVGTQEHLREFEGVGAVLLELKPASSTFAPKP